MMIIMTCSSFNKWITENKKLITIELLSSSQSRRNKFALLSFTCWDFSKYSKGETHKQKLSIAEEFRLLVQDEFVENVKQSRSRKEKYVLYARRTSGIILNMAVVVCSWYAIFMIISTQQSVINALYLVFGQNFAKAVHPTFAIVGVGLVLPQLTFAITNFEAWDSKIQTMKHQIWRLYFGRIANLIVAGIPAFIIYKDLEESNFVYTTFSDPVDALIGKNVATGTYSVFAEDKYLCFEDVASYYLIKLVISDFLLGKLIKIFMYYVKRILKLPHAPYNVAESIIEVCSVYHFTFR